MARQDAHAGILATLMCLAWLLRLVWSGSAVLLLRQPSLLRPVAYCASCLVPAALVKWRRQHWYCRWGARDMGVHLGGCIRAGQG